MENLYQLDQFPMETHHEYNPAFRSHLDYHQTQNHLQLESNRSDCGRVPHISSPPTSLPNVMDLTDSHQSLDFDMDHLASEWSHTQILFDHDLGEAEMAYSELNVGMAQAEFYSPPEVFWPLCNLESD